MTNNRVQRLFPTVRRVANPAIANVRFVGIPSHCCVQLSNRNKEIYEAAYAAAHEKVARRVRYRAAIQSMYQAN